MTRFLAILLVVLLTFTTISCTKQEQPQILDAPVLYVNPSSNDYLLYNNDTQVCFSWKPVADATNYYLELTECNDFETFQQKVTTTETKFCIHIDELTCKRNLKWRLQALGNKVAKSPFAYAIYNVYQINGPPIDFWCSIPEDFNVLINGNLQIPSQNLDTTFVDLPATFNMHYPTRNYYVIEFRAVHSNTNNTIFEYISLQVLDDQSFYPIYTKINGQDSVLVSGSLTAIGSYLFYEGTVNFGNNASGQISFVTVP